MKIRLEQLTKVFGNKEGVETVAVSELSLDIPSGKLIGLLGPSGCGKSTTLFMIAGLHEPTDGRIFFGEDDVTEIPAEKRGIGLVFQNYALYPHMTVRQNIAFPLENSKSFKAQFKADPVKVEELKAAGKEDELKEYLESFKGSRKKYKAELERLVVETANIVDIDDLLERKPAQLSGGQQQRVAIARALAKKPKVLLLDEPLSNLDARLRLQTREEIKKIQRKTGITTIFVTHDQEEAMSISDEIVVMKDGILQQVDAPQSMYENPGNQFVAKFLGNPPINVFDADIKDNKILLNNKNILDVNLPNQKVSLAVRPEAFRVVEKDGIKVTLTKIEHIGRDKLVGFELNNQKVNALVDANIKREVGDDIMVEILQRGSHIFNLDGERVVVK